MDKKRISEKELKIIEEIAKNKTVTQRELSRKAGISVGMVNMSLKKLAKRGYVKIKGMNKRSLEYVLTPKGFSEKAKKSYRYFRGTLASLREMKEKIQTLILEEYSKGRKNFVILGDGELADIVEISFKDLHLPDLNYRRVKEQKVMPGKNWTVLSTNESYSKPLQIKNYINIIDILSK